MVTSLLPREKIIIIGAGAAGLAAATALRGSASVLVLDAQTRLGGRVHTDHSLGVPVELGAAWIHRAEGNIVSELAHSFGCTTAVSENKRLVVYRQSGEQVGTATLTRVYQLLSRSIMPEILRRRSTMRADGRDDVSLGTLASSLPSLSDIHGVKRCVLDFLLFRDIVQDHTADLWQTSAARYDTDHYGGAGKDHVLPGGFDCVIDGMKRSSGLRVRAPAHLAEQDRGLWDLGRHNTHAGIRLGEAGEVTRLRWSDAGVEATLANGVVEIADRVIVTVPLGVLKASIARDHASGSTRADGSSQDGHARVLSFEPSLPSHVLMAIGRLGYGEALKVALRFPAVFWPREAHFLGKVGGECHSLGSAQRHMEFLNVAKFTDEPVLLMETETGHARELATMSDPQIVQVVVDELRRMFGADQVPSPVGAVVARLGNNSFQRGGFTFMPPGCTHELHRILATPLANGRLIMAGEHTSSLHAGTVHGAIVSGRRAAAHARAAMRGRDVLAGGEEYEEAYKAELFRSIYDEDREEETWDRNP